MSLDARVRVEAPTAFVHEAFFYANRDEYIDGLAPFVRDGVANDEAVLVAVGNDQEAWLRSALGPVALSVAFLDMPKVGANPGRIIPLWIEFVDANRKAGRPMRGIGEPLYAGRRPEAIAECHQHEALLNVAFANSPPWLLMCPYDRASLDQDSLARAHHTHPVVGDHHGSQPSTHYSAEAQADLAGPRLPDAPAGHQAMPFDLSNMRSVRAAVSRFAVAAGLAPDRCDALVLSASELMTNSVLHGFGSGVLRLWEDGSTVICEVEDDGGIADPLAGRRPPRPEQTGGRGLWLVHTVCDLVHVRSDESRSLIRMLVDKPGIATA